MPPVGMDREPDTEPERGLNERVTQLVSACRSSATESARQGKFDEAAELLSDCRTAVVKMCGEQTDVDLIKQISDESKGILIKGGLTEEAYRKYLQEYAMHTEKDPYTIFYTNLDLAMLASKIPSPKTLEHIKTIETLSIPFLQFNHKLVAREQVQRLASEYYFAIDEYDKAERCIKDVISIFLTSSKVKGATNISTEALTAYSVLQEIFAAQGMIQELLDVVDEEVESHTTGDKEDSDFQYYLGTVALACYYHGYEDHAERIYNRIIQLYREDFQQILEMAEPDNLQNLIRLLITFSVTDLACLYYNQGNHEQYQKTIEILPENLNSQTHSRYFTSTIAELSHVPTMVDKYRFTLELSVVSRKRMKNVKSLRFRITGADGTVFADDTKPFDPAVGAVFWHSSPMDLVPRGEYVYLTDIIFEDTEKVYTHIQRSFIDY